MREGERKSCTGGKKRDKNFWLKLALPFFFVEERRGRLREKRERKREEQKSFLRKNGKVGINISASGSRQETHI